MKTVIRKITNASLILFISASYAANAMEEQEGKELTAQIRAEVARVLEKFHRNMEEYYQRTGAKRKGNNSTRVTENTAVNPEVKAQEPTVAEEEAKAFTATHKLALTLKQKGKERVDYTIRQLPPNEQEEKKNDDQYKVKQYADYLFHAGEIDDEGMQLALHKVEEFLREKKDYPTKSEILAMLDLPLDNPEIAQLAQRYDMAEYQVGKLKGYWNFNLLRVFLIPDAGQMQEWVRLRYHLNVWPNLKQIEEGIRQKRYLKILFPSIEQINEGLRLTAIGIHEPSEDQINEGLRLIKIGIKRPSEDQIDAGLYIRKEETAEEVEKLVAEKVKPAKKIADDAETVQLLYKYNLWKNPSYKPSIFSEERLGLRGLAMTLIEAFPDLDAALLQKAYQLNIKDPVYVKELRSLIKLDTANKLGISDIRTWAIWAIWVIEEGMRQNKFRPEDKPATVDQIKEGLEQDFCKREEASPAYVERVDEGVRQKSFWSPSEWRSQSMELINEGLRQNKERGRETDINEIRAGLTVKSYKKDKGDATVEEINAYLYLKELERESSGENKEISLYEPTWEEIEKEAAKMTEEAAKMTEEAAKQEK